MHTLWKIIVSSLKDMAQESVNGGKPYALRGYPDFYREQKPGSFHASRWEEPYFWGLRDRLGGNGYSTQVEVGYPANRRRHCDLVVTLPSRQRVWIEVKTAFAECLHETTGASYNYDYEGDRLYKPYGKRSWRAGVRDLGGKDCEKLSTLTSTDADYVGLLLLGFDRKNSPLDESVLYSLLPVEKPGWMRCHSLKEGLLWDDYYGPR